MRVCELEALLEELDRVVSADDERRAAAQAGRATAERLAPLLPLVHRTGKRGTASAARILAEGRLRAEPVKTEGERELGLDQAVYLFLGYPAYPHGRIAFVVRSQALPSGGTFSPFDSGALEGGWLEPASGPFTDAATRAACLAQYTGAREVLEGFTGPYLAAHFRDARDYVRVSSPGLPDFPPYHGLRSTTGDRRAWTIEVRASADVDLLPSPDLLEEIAIDGVDLLEQVPDHYVAFAVVREGDLDFAEWLSSRIAARLEAA